MRVLVTGAAGFIGSHLSHRLVERGDEVLGFDNLNNYYDPALKQARLDRLLPRPGFSFVKGALEDRGTPAARGIASRRAACFRITRSTTPRRIPGAWPSRCRRRATVSRR